MDELERVEFDKEGVSNSKQAKTANPVFQKNNIEADFKKGTDYLKDGKWQEAVKDIISKNPNGVILDVRNNPGGYLDGAVFVTSEFLEGGDVVLQEDGQGKKQAFKVNREGNLLTIPLIVLINKGSASASEIVAGALQDRERAKLVGEQSFGKGTIQEAEELEKGAGIHITVARWLTPNGKWVNETKGLKPDVIIEMPKDAKDNQDPQLDKALELLE